MTSIQRTELTIEIYSDFLYKIFRAEEKIRRSRSYRNDLEKKDREISNMAYRNESRCSLLEKEVHKLYSKNSELIDKNADLEIEMQENEARYKNKRIHEL